jgi:hypothetical protein
MKKFIIIPILLLAMSSSGAVRTTVNDPNTWDCNCFPFSADDVIIFHDVTQIDYIGLNNLTIKSDGSLSATNFTVIDGDVIVES